MIDISISLKAIVDLELTLGNKIIRIDQPAGTRCPFAIIFQDPLHFKEIKTNLNLSSTVEYWENHDRHYPLEEGYICLETRHTIAGPLRGTNYKKERI